MPRSLLLLVLLLGCADLDTAEEADRLGGRGPRFCAPTICERVIADIAPSGLWPDEWPVGTSLQPIAPPDLAVAWHEQIAIAAGLWNQALGAGCPRMFYADTVNDHGKFRPVRMVDPEDWSHGDDTAGYWNEDGIDIRARASLDGVSGKIPVLLHELGHAIGLEHRSSVSSVMNPLPRALFPDPRDAGLVRAWLDCQ